ncbi:hypothetical protein T265_02044 [Opisthorchis viverrini]|uniref:Uncharacterized protein n=1 Tax=Opisthorchis viverrini TaxID=6198 RepID=A0A075A0P9_OPIVI|nr:hypothetical protein T265_02044 [Opisthorchis viverrini]KER31817.1 hypothetical protein T265_02044 [Opisthorchis viverrini]
MIAAQRYDQSWTVVSSAPKGSRKKRSSVAPFQCLTAIPPEGSMRAGILPGCPTLDTGSR